MKKIGYPIYIIIDKSHEIDDMFSNDCIDSVTYDVNEAKEKFKALRKFCEDNSDDDKYTYEWVLQEWTDSNQYSMIDHCQNY